MNEYRHTHTKPALFVSSTHSPRYQNRKGKYIAYFRANLITIPAICLVHACMYPPRHLPTSHPPFLSPSTLHPSSHQRNHPLPPLHTKPIQSRTKRTLISKTLSPQTLDLSKKRKNQNKSKPKPKPKPKPKQKQAQVLTQTPQLIPAYSGAEIAGGVGV